ncbi:UDP-glucose 6-dehydrogenase [Eikenella sp. S3360]|uniref:UDP-glucose 6-dehydrogenase n=1 Tax=Eikenella glucosivorans TaxID=2766967 RepID=A0ABS0N9G8_9NEIS|nr:UDP-glucose 6-dehydrogenase [Eikenella glucosivorans]MBH5328939.1 UDP-glucose 6-dehydrogenase [Eikenella glucosivorans]
MKTLLLLASLLGTAAPALACKALSPEAAFVAANDRNGDGVLSRSEWRRAKLPANLAAEGQTGTRAAFRLLDADRNGKLSHSELSGRFDYIEHPCAEWQRQFNTPPAAAE